MGDMELQIFADRLKQLRTEKGLTQAQFVDSLGITTSALSAYEKNLKNPSISVAKRIAEKYNTSIDWLCGLSEVKSFDGKIETFGDLFRTIFELEKACGQYLEIITKFDFDALGNCNNRLEGIAFSQDEAQTFLTEWQKMKQLHDDGTIDDDLYNLWKEKALCKEYIFKPDGSFVQEIQLEETE